VFGKEIIVLNSELLELGFFPLFRLRNRNMKNPRNLVGLQIRRLRDQQKLTQPMLAARCRRWGWDLSRETLAKIETQLRWVSDFELLCLARALRVDLGALLPPKDNIPKMLEDFFERLSSSVE
jgi:transcriptional regulator with XRE-family HTH domain